MKSYRKENEKQKLVNYFADRKG